MTIYFADRDMAVLGMASTNLPNGLVVTEDLKTEEVETGVATFSCKLTYTAENRQAVERCGAVGNYLFRNAGMGNELYTILETEADTEACTVYLYAEDAGLGLLNAVALAYAAETAQPIAFYFERWLEGSGFTIGLNEAGSGTKQLAWDSEATVTERLQDVAEQFGCELSFRFDIDGLRITGQYADIHQKRGKDIGAQLRLNADVSRIVAKRTIENLATSLLVVGGTPDGAAVPVTLEGYQYDDGDCYVSGRYLNSRNALAQWGERGPDGAQRQIVRLFTCDALGQETLCSLAVAELGKSSGAEVNYEIELAQLPAGVRIGDRVNIVDDAGGLYLSARILKLETSIADDTRTATLGEYLIRDSGISQKVEDLAKQVAVTASSAKSASATASTAQASADGAQSTADAAQTSADAAQSTANSAQTTADAAQSAADSAQSAASTAQSTADGKNTVYYQTSKPTGGTYQVNDLWFDTDDGSKMYYWDGSAWTAQTFGASALSANSVTAEKIVSSAITTEKLAANAVTANKIDVTDLFAQDITASGTISGLKLRGEDISIGDSYTSGNVYSEGEFVGKVFDDGSQKYYMFDLTTQSHYVDSSIECSLSSITMDGYGGVSFMSRGSNGYITMEAPDISISATNPIELNAPIVSSTCTSFSGGVVSSGSVVVVKKLGWCQVFGEFTLTGTVSDWTEILAAAKVPAPQHGTNIYPAAMQWGSSFLRLPRIQVNGGGGLRVRYGAAGTYDFSVAYPIE